jgi:hypothetical protein
MNRLLLSSILVGLILGAVPAVVLSQSRLDPGALPKSTSFYFAWHGTPSGDARKANSLLALWDDADLAAVREALIEGMLQSSPGSQKKPSAWTHEELAQYASLLDNELIVGHIGNPHPLKATGTAPSSLPSRWNGLFLVYDRMGKEATLASLLLRTRSSEKETPRVSSVSIAGISAIKVERKTDTTYWAEDGKYAFAAYEPAVFQQIANWTKHPPGEADVLAQTEAYKEAAGILKGGVVEFFFHFPSIRETNWDTSAGGFRLLPLLQSLRLEAVHVIAGHLALEGTRTRVQAAILGETSPGTLFDIWDDGTTTPLSWQFINSNTASYQESRINLLGIYGLIKHALQSTAVAGEKNPLDFIETAAATRLGMPLPAAFALFTGEVTAMQSSPTLDPHKRVYILGIQKKPETLKVLRAALAEQVALERTEGEITFLKISAGGMSSAAGTASWNYYHLAITNNLIVGSSRIDSVRETLAMQKGTTDNSNLVPQAWLAARAQYPPKVTGLNFMDFQKINWGAIKARWNLEEAHPVRADAGANKKSSGDPSADAFSKALKQLDPQIFPRHLHFSTGAAWKDAQGVHFDGWIE